MAWRAALRSALAAALVALAGCASAGGGRHDAGGGGKDLARADGPRPDLTGMAGADLAGRDASGAPDDLSMGGGGADQAAPTDLAMKPADQAMGPADQAI